MDPANSIDGDGTTALDRMMAQSTIEEMPHSGQFLAEWPQSPFRCWYLADSREAAEDGLRRIMGILYARNLL